MEFLIKGNGKLSKVGGGNVGEYNKEMIFEWRIGCKVGFYL